MRLVTVDGPFQDDDRNLGRVGRMAPEAVLPDAEDEPRDLARTKVADAFLP